MAHWIDNQPQDWMDFLGVRKGQGSTTADISMVLTADSLPELFMAAASYLGELMFSGSRAGSPNWLPVRITAEDLPGLMVALLNEVVYLADGEGLLTVGLQLDHLGEKQLAGRLGVIPLDPAVHRAGEPVKAATYHQAQVEPVSGSRWRAQVILDV